MIGNPGPGGAATIWRQGDTWSLSDADTTILLLTMTALIEGLSRAPAAKMIEVRTATKYLVNSFQFGWAKTWRDNGWRRSKGGIVANVDLWERLVTVISGHTTPIEWTHGKPIGEYGQLCRSLAAQASAMAGGEKTLA